MNNYSFTFRTCQSQFAGKPIIATNKGLQASVHAHGELYRQHYISVTFLCFNITFNYL
jgi:hypothetical protein